MPRRADTVEPDGDPVDDEPKPKRRAQPTREEIDILERAARIQDRKRSRARLAELNRITSHPECVPKKRGRS